MFSLTQHLIVHKLWGILYNYLSKFQNLHTNMKPSLVPWVPLDQGFCDPYTGHRKGKCWKVYFCFWQHLTYIQCHLEKGNILLIFSSETEHNIQVCHSVGGRGKYLQILLTNQNRASLYYSIVCCIKAVINRLRAEQWQGGDTRIMCMASFEPRGVTIVCWYFSYT